MRIRIMDPIDALEMLEQEASMPAEVYSSEAVQNTGFFLHIPD